VVQHVVGESSIEGLTAVQQAEAATAASERRLRLAHEAAELGSWQWHMETGLVVWDERLEAIFGLAPGGYDGTFETWLEMIHPEHRDEVMEIVNQALEQRSSYRLEMRVVWPDGVVHWVESYGRVTTDQSGEPTGTIGCVWDTTARHEVEALAASMLTEREKLTTRLSDIAEHLQSSLAASPLPDVPGVSIAVHYAPGGDELEHVGGDWYDAVRTPDQRLAFVVGDVMGRGVQAATTMVRVRAGIRGLLTVDPSPEVVLAHADAMLERDAPEQFVTAVAALVDPATGRLSLCNAGHVPVVVVRGDGTTRLLDEGSGLPLGMPEGIRRSCVDVDLGPGDTVVLVTDGVVEARDHDIDEGLDRLADLVSRLGRASLSDLVREVATLADRSLRDDVTVVAVRRD
jgi:PAS domain S-box-containing protein